MSRPVRLAIVQPAAAPYRFASFSALAAREDVDLLVAYLSRGSQPYDWRADDREARFPRVVLETAALWGVHPFPIGLRRTLRRFGPDVTIVGGWDEPAYHIVAMGRPRLGRRVVLWVESTAEDRRGRSRVKDAVKRAMLRWADAVLVPGSSARHYCESLGASRRYFVASNAVDNERFLAGARRARHGPAPFRLPRPVFLYVGRLDPEKGVDVLLEAWRRAGARQGSLLLVGTGRMEARLKRQAAGLDRERVRFAGFIPQRDLPAWYGHADVFVFPSRSDPWGMVINEAMACGLPIIATSAPGAVGELVRDGENGRVVRPGDPSALATAIHEFAADAELRSRMGRVSERAIQSFTPGAWAGAVAAMVRDLR